MSSDTETEEIIQEQEQPMEDSETEEETPIEQPVPQRQTRRKLKALSNDSPPPVEKPVSKRAAKKKKAKRKKEEKIKSSESEESEEYIERKPRNRNKKEKTKSDHEMEEETHQEQVEHTTHIGQLPSIGDFTGNDLSSFNATIASTNVMNAKMNAIPSMNNLNNMNMIPPLGSLNTNGQNNQNNQQENMNMINNNLPNGNPNVTVSSLNSSNNMINQMMNVEVKMEQEQIPQYQPMIYNFDSSNPLPSRYIAYDPMVGLYSDLKQNTNQRTTDMYEMNKTKQYVSRFVVDILQPFYDNLTIQSREDFKAFAKQLTMEICDKLKKNGTYLSSKNTQYFEDLIKSRVKERFG